MIAAVRAEGTAEMGEAVLVHIVKPRKKGEIRLVRKTREVAGKAIREAWNESPVQRDEKMNMADLVSVRWRRRGRGTLPRYHGGSASSVGRDMPELEIAPILGIRKALVSCQAG